MIARCAAVIALCAPIATAASSPGEEPLDGAVFAGPTGTNPAGIASNPASLLRITPGWYVFGGGIGRLEQISIDRRLLDVDGNSSAGPSVDGHTTGAGGQLGTMLAWPGGMIAGLFTLQPPDETLEDEPALGYHSLGSRNRRIEVTLAGGYRYGRAVHVAFAVGTSERRTVLQFTRDTALEAGRDPTRGVGSDCGGLPCGLEHPAATETWRIDGYPDHLNLDNLVLSGGLLVQLPRATLLGLSLQRPWRLGAYELSGSATIGVAPRDGGGIRTGEATVFVGLPEVWRLGTRTTIAPLWELVTELRWRRLDGVGAYDVRTHGGDLAAGGVPEYYARARGLRDAVAAEVGLEQVDIGQLVTIGARIGGDTGATGGDRISPTSPWGAELTAAVGVQLRPTPRLLVQLGYRGGYQPTVAVARSGFDPLDRIDCVESGYDYDLPACATVRAGYGLPTAAGTYGRSSHTGWLSVRFLIW